MNDRVYEDYGEARAEADRIGGTVKIIHLSKWLVVPPEHDKPRRRREEP